MKQANLAPNLAILLLIALTVLPLGLLPRLSVSNAPEVYFPSDSQALLFEKQLRTEFPEDQVLVALFQGSEIFSVEFLWALHRVAEQLQTNPLVERVLTVTTVDHIAGSEDGFEVELLIDPGLLAKDTDQARRDRVLSDRFAPEFLAAKDATALALIIRPVPIDDSRERLALETTLRQLVEQQGIAPQLAAVAGPVALDAAQLRASNADNALFIPSMFLVGMLFIWLLFKRVIALVLAGLSIGAVVSPTVAIIVLLERPFTLVASIIPPLMTALTLAFLFHFYNALAYASRRGFYGEKRVRKALDEILRPARFVALTTGIGLFSLSLSPIQPIQTFGLVSGAGIAVMYLIVLVLLPPIMARWDDKQWDTSGSWMSWVDTLVIRMTRIGIRRAGWVILIAVVLLALGLPQILRVQAETDVYKFFPAHHPLIVSTHTIEEKFPGVVTLDVVLEGSDRDALLEPQRLKAIRDFQRWAEQLQEITWTLSMADIVEEMNWGFHGEDASFRDIPSRRSAIAQYLLIYDGTDLYDLVNRDMQRTRVIVFLNVHSAKAVGGVMEKIRSYFAENNAMDMDWNIAGSARLYVDQVSLMVKGLVKSFSAAVIFIFFVMVMLWRSFPAAVLCMIPNVSPIVLIFVVMGIFGIWLDVATAMIASIAVGVAVDDTIHIYHGYARRRASGRGLVLSLVRSCRMAGRAVTATTVVLCAQFLLLCSSSFIPTVQFGLLTAVGLMAALIFDLLLLPALVVLLHRRAQVG